MSISLAARVPAPYQHDRRGGTRVHCFPSAGRGLTDTGPRLDFGGEREYEEVMGKLINAPDEVVSEALRGLAAAHPSLRVDLDLRVVVRADAPRTGKVGLVSGGGSGHEPLHTGFVGF